MVGRREEKRWLREVRETTSDTTVIPPLWWVREREERKSECDCVQLWTESSDSWLFFCKTRILNFHSDSLYFQTAAPMASSVTWPRPPLLKKKKKEATAVGPLRAATFSTFRGVVWFASWRFLTIRGVWTSHFLLLITWNLCYKQDGVWHTWGRKSQVKVTEHSSCIMGNIGSRKSGFLGLCSFDSNRVNFAEVHEHTD